MLGITVAWEGFELVPVKVAAPGRAHRLAVVCGLAMAVATLLAPPMAGVAVAAATSLKEVSTATYTLDPDRGAVHVVLENAYTNRKPDSGGFFYFYDRFTSCIHAEASAIKASDSKGSLKFSTKKVAAYEEGSTTYFPCTQVTVRLRARLLYKHTTTVRISFDMVGDPRSTARIRAGQGYATFPVWTWGDDGFGKAVVHLPAGFVATVLHSAMTSTVKADGSTDLTASPAHQSDFWSQIQATRRDGYEDESIALGDGAAVHLRSLADDPDWVAALGPDLRTGVPLLHDLIGLPLPTTEPIELRETYAPTLANVVWLPLSRDQGYGISPYRTPTEISIGEALDTQAALSAAATMWFNETLFKGRWIAAGLADAYSARALTELGRPTTAPEPPDSSAAGALPLELWVSPYLSDPTLKQEPTVIKTTDEREAYGANASWYVVDSLVAAVGIERMRDVFTAAATDQIAYVGAGVPETVDMTDGWQRFLDLLEERGGPDGAAAIEQLFKDYVLSTTNVALLGPRGDARASYAKLLETGGEWSAPIVVRTAMGKWDFPAATSAIEAAHGILDLRKQVADAANALGLTPGPALRAAYEGATENFDDARAQANAELDALAAIAKARAAIDAPHDFVTSIGLIGVTLETPFALATAAFTAGDLEGALAGATSVATSLEDATVSGRQRLTIAGATVGLLLLLLLVVAVVLLRRRRRRRVAVPAEPPTPE